MRSIVAAVLVLVGAVWPGAAHVLAAEAHAVDDEAPRSSSPESEPAPPPPRAAIRPMVIEDLAEPRVTAVYMMFGVGTPVGGIGVEGVHRFSNWFELSAGFGLGTGASEVQPHGGDSFQRAAMPRLRVRGDEGHILAFGVGMSGGQYSSDGIPCFGCDDGASANRESPTAYTLWTNFEVSGERWGTSGFAFRYYLGYAHGTMVQKEPSANQLLVFPYFGVGPGHAF
jgi:hypothetical protein